MPLSEHEQRLLDQLEKQLGADDPTFAHSMNSGSSAVRSASVSPRNIVIGSLVALVGLGVIVTGVATKLILVGVLGFIIAGAGIFWATTQPQKKTAQPAGTNRHRASSRQKQEQSSGFMKTLEDKWDKRQNGF